MTDNEIIKALECCAIKNDCKGCYFDTHEAGDICAREVVKNAFDLINRQQTKIERLHDEVSKTRRKALLEASSKFAGHSDYHGDTILCKLICMSEGKEVEIAKPLDKSEMKSEAVKEFAEKLKENIVNALDKYYNTGCGGYYLAEDVIDDIDTLVEEIVGDTE